MTKFEPEVAYRILNERYERLIAEKSYEDEIDRLRPVLMYLRNRIEEERNDAV